LLLTQYIILSKEVNVVCCQLTIRVHTVALLSVKICLIPLESFAPVTRPIPVEFWLDLPNGPALPVRLRAASQVALSFTHFGGERCDGDLLTHSGVDTCCRYLLSSTEV
jgi:hypothetical protein